MQNVEKQVLTFLNSKLVTCIESSDISECHSIINKTSNKPDNVIVRFINRKSKIELLKRARVLKGTNIYMNEHLTTIKKQSASLHSMNCAKIGQSFKNLGQGLIDIHKKFRITRHCKKTHN